MTKDFVHLLIETGPFKGQRLAVPESGLKIGRERDNELAIPDLTISRNHCRFFFRAGHLWVADLQSANGTLVNGQTITNCELSKGDHVLAGDTRIRVLHDTWQAVPSFRERARMARAAAKQGAPRRSASSGSFFRSLLWLALMLWWLLLAYSLCLPPPASEPSSESVTVEPPPLEEPAAPVPVEHAPATPAPENAESTPAPAVPQGDPEAMRNLRDFVAHHLISEDYARAADMITAHLQAEHTPEEKEQLAALGRYVAGVQALNQRMAEALSAQAGRRITLRRGATNVQFRVIAVSATKMNGVVYDASGERELAIDLTKLHPVDRMEWLGKPTTPEANALWVVLELKAGAVQEAARHAAEAGLLADEFRAIIASGARPVAGGSS